MEKLGIVCGMAGVLAWVGVAWALRDRSGLARSLAGFVAAIAVGGAIGFLGSYLTREADPAALVERELARAFPDLVEALKEQDPSALRDLEAQLRAAYRDNGGQVSDAAQAKALAVIGAFRLHLQLVAVRADDDLVL
jgi:hypothetical protein